MSIFSKTFEKQFHFPMTSNSFLLISLTFPSEICFPDFSLNFHVSGYPDIVTGYNSLNGGKTYTKSIIKLYNFLKFNIVLSQQTSQNRFLMNHPKVNTKITDIKLY